MSSLRSAVPPATMLIAMLIGSPAAAAEGDKPPAGPPFQWASIGPTFIQPSNLDYDTTGSSGRIASLNLNGERLLAATANGGVWAYDTKARTWSPLTDRLPNLAFGAVSSAPSNPHVIYASTGEQTNCMDCALGDDVYRSSDDGVTWTTLTPLPTFASTGKMRTSSVVVNPTDENDVWIGGTLGVYRSTDGGTKWTRIYAVKPVPDDAPQPVVNLVLDPSNPHVAYFTDRKHIMKYDASTAILSDVSVPEPTAFAAENPDTTYLIAIAIAPTNSNVIYASYAYTGNFNSGCLAGLYRSVKAGTSWDPITVPAGSDYLSVAYEFLPDDPGCQGWYDNVLAVDPKNENHLAAGGVGLADFVIGRDLTQPAQQSISRRSHAHSDHHALVFDGDGNLYDGSDGGVWYYSRATLAPNSPDTGDSRSGGLVATQFWPGVSVLRSSGAIVAGSQDNGVDLYAPGPSGWTWTRLAPGDGGYTAYDQANDILYYETQEGNLSMSVHGGASNPIMPPFGKQAPAFVMPLVMDESDPRHLWAGGRKLYETHNSGVKWSEASPQQTDAITHIDATTGGGGIAFGNADGRVGYRFGNELWRNAQFDGAVNVVKFDRFDRGTIFVGTRDDNHPFAAHLIRISGADGPSPTQTPWESGLGGPVDSLLFTPNVILAGTDRGLYARGRLSSTWSRVPGIPAVPVVDLALTGSPALGMGSVVAITHGRGAWLSNDIAFLTP